MFCFQWQKQASIAIGSSQEEVESGGSGACFHHNLTGRLCMDGMHTLSIYTCNMYMLHPSAQKFNY